VIGHVIEQAKPVDKKVSVEELYKPVEDETAWIDAAAQDADDHDRGHDHDHHHQHDHGHDHSGHDHEHHHHGQQHSDDGSKS
jgi:hypothetical protein